MRLSELPFIILWYREKRVGITLFCDFRIQALCWASSLSREDKEQAKKVIIVLYLFISIYIYFLSWKCRLHWRSLCTSLVRSAQRNQWQRPQNCFQRWLKCKIMFMLWELKNKRKNKGKRHDPANQVAAQWGYYLQKTSQIHPVGVKPPQPSEFVLLFNMTETGLDAEWRKVLGPHCRSFLKLPWVIHLAR